MGYNSTVVVMNDALHSIENDPEFGRKLKDAILTVQRGRPVDVSAGGFCNAATVIETHHADGLIAVVVGVNGGQILGYCGTWHRAYSDKMDDESRKEYHLKNLARDCGYRLVKLPKQKKGK